LSGCLGVGIAGGMLSRLAYFVKLVDIMKTFALIGLFLW
jgi:hypothetical protein